MMTTRKMYVNKRIELTLVSQALEMAGYKTYRTRSECSCCEKKNRRDSVIAIKDGGFGYAIEIVRCRNCFNKKPLKY